jgi:hypothetical protein
VKRRAALGALAALCLVPNLLPAQRRAPPPQLAPSTARLGAVERALRIELAAGTQLGRDRDPYSSGRLRGMAIGALRWTADEGAGLRVWLLHARRRAGYDKPDADFTVLGASADLSLRTGRRTTLAFSYGMGLAGVRVHPAPSSQPSYDEGEEKLSPLFGIALRHRMIVAELHLAVLGGDAYTPLTIGFRF